MGDTFEMEVDIDKFFEGLTIANTKAIDVAEESMNDVVDELVRISSEIAPFDKGTLQKSHESKVSRKFSGIIEGTVIYSVMEEGFNYALWTHEGIYQNGEKTERRPGTTGWSGSKYEAGRKYLQRPVEGEQKAFLEHMAKQIGDVIAK